MIHITGDTHGYWDERENFLQSLPKTDIVICLGDLGWSWDINHINGFVPSCEWLSVLGNHENYTLIEKMPVVEKYGGKMRQMKDNVFYLMNGEMYEIEGKKFFVFGGALSIDKHYRTPYVSWWPQEQPTREDFNHALDTLERNNWTFDVMLTHTAETEIVREMLGRQDTINDSTETMILELKYQIKEHGGKFSYHFFGHMHDYWIYCNNLDYLCMCLYDQVYNLDKKDLEFPLTYF